MRNKKLFYSTGFKSIFSAWDILKVKIRLWDYDDINGIRYSYLFAIKIFDFEYYIEKYVDQKGVTHNRKLRFGGNK